MSFSEEELRQQRVDFFDTLRGNFQRAEAAAGGWSWQGNIGGQRLCLRGAGQELCQRIVPALHHVAVEPEQPAHLTISLWDSHSSQTSLPVVLRAFLERVAEHRWDWLDARWQLRFFNDERFRTVFRLGPTNILSVYDAQTASALYWVERAQDLPYWEVGSPLQTILNWWTGDCGLQYVHAAAVGHQHGALLLTGPGGSGKSTTALACLRAGMGYLGDDYCLVSSDRVYSLYGTAKLNGEADFVRFPELAGWVENKQRPADHKALFNVARHRPQQMLLEAPLRAVVLPRFRPGARSQLRPVAGAEALRALAPTTLFQLAGTRQQGLTRMASLLRIVPSYVLELGEDIDCLPQVLATVLHR